MYECEDDIVNISRGLAERMSIDLKRLGLDNMSEVLYRVSKGAPAYTDEEYFKIVGERNELSVIVDTLNRQVDQLKKYVAENHDFSLASQAEAWRGVDALIDELAPDLHVGADESRMSAVLDYIRSLRR